MILNDFPMYMLHLYKQHFYKQHISEIDLLYIPILKTKLQKKQVLEFWISLSNIRAWAKKRIANKNGVYTPCPTKRVRRKWEWKNFHRGTSLAFLLGKTQRGRHDERNFESTKVLPEFFAEVVPLELIIHEKIFYWLYIFYHLVQILSNKARKLFLPAKKYTLSNWHFMYPSLIKKPFKISHT